ncbi:apoptotic protease-activating factor 1 isoform X2 [Ceratina calcarata]|uniref:Apoptotic protease-activating factor 1 isoform X2 n=1 Tax=Ceratina calcarata TaxID=156304 RepID=A0AAJ7J4V1_9HYME|nr:apoptotic protease-activating factor 1 isoform X2 [Ceratina calcarata]
MKMDELHQHILKTLRRKIVADMDVHNNVIKPLQLRDILTDQHITKIESGTSKERRAEILLDILPSCGPNAFNFFRQALRLHYEWLSEEMDNLEMSGKPFNNIKYGGAPALPPISPSTVERQQKLKEQLTKLQPNGYILLHGMKGFGRSCLAASTLNDVDFVRKEFNNEVYWIKFGYKRSIEEETLIQLIRLYHLVKNLEILPLSPQSEIKGSLIHFLKDYFNKHPNALLILDDVWDRSIIEAFDFECKTLVISTNREYLWGKRPSVIRLNDGFTEAETLGLFAKVLDTEVESLPQEAKQIHAECKGMPLLISMFSAQFEEFKHDMRISSKRWRYYLESLKKHDKKTRVIKDFWDIQKGIFDTCIQQLSVEMRNLYEELVIFREDVNITPETLKILWEENPYRVEEMMLDLCHKSLAAKEWNDKLNSYIYGVHDLLLCHLREKFSPDDIIEKHKSLIKKYHEYSNGDFSKLPGDNYSYSYIGYHLEQARMYDEFPRIYLDFDFIESAIIYSGLNNLLIDFNIYKKYITKDHDSVYELRFHDLEKFLEEQSSIIAEHRRKRCLDIVQIAMNHPYQGYVKDTAMKLAEERSNCLYILHDKKSQNMDMPMSEEMSTEVVTTCFTHDPDQILFGNKVGEIYSWDSVNKRQTLFSGHSKMSCIKKIVVSSDGDCFLSLDDQGIVRLFKLSDDEDEQDKCIPPKQKQDFWQGIYTSEIPHDHSSMKFSVPEQIILDMVFAYDNSRVVACTDKGMIVVWDRFGNMKWQCHYPNGNSYLKYVAFTTESNLLHVMDEVNGVLISYNRTDKDYKYLSQYNPNLEGKKIIFFRNAPEQTNSLLIVTEKKAVYVKFFVSTNSLMHLSMHSYKKQVRATVEDEKTVFVCASLTNDGQYIVLADSSGFINVWDAEGGFQSAVVTYKSRVSSLDTYWMKEGYHIICGSQNRLLHKWKLPVEGTCLTTKKPLFDAKVQKFGSEPDVIVTETLSNTIVVLNNDVKVAETEPINGKINNLILHEGTIIYVTDKGMVNIFDIKSKQSTPALQFSSSVELIKILDLKSDVDNNYVIICRESKENLRVWKTGKISYLVLNAGYVISIHKIDEENLVTVTKNGVITVWRVDGTNWIPIDQVKIGNSITSSSSCLSYQKNYLIVLNENGCVVVYKLYNQTITFPPNIKVTEYCRKIYSHKLRCCEISQNEKYLAIGFENGHISIIDVSMTSEICQLHFHTDPVTQLNWAPSSIEVPILLSVSSDEIVWWNIILAMNSSKKKKSGMNRSISTPFPNGDKMDDSLCMSTSQSVDSGMYEMQSENSGTSNVGYDSTKFWKSKKGKDPKHPALLAVVELSSNFFAKVCVSADFTRFVTVDIYGSISTFTLCGYN